MFGNYYVSDIETLKEVALFSFYNPEKDEWKEFEISKRKNELSEFLNFYNSGKIDHLIFFNGISFDQQVIEWINHNYRDWSDLTSEQIAEGIYEYANDVIESSHYKLRAQFAETQFKVPQFDLFKIWHYDREQRSTGLKKLEFSMDMENIEEMPFPPWTEGLTSKDIDNVRFYCRNDIIGTERFFRYSLGQCEHSTYKGDNKIEMRLALREEFDMPSINISDSKIGDLIIRTEYCKASGIPDKDLPKKGVFRKVIYVSDCIAPYVSFKTNELQEFLEKIKEKKLKFGEDFSEVLKYKGQVYDFKKGGLHNRISGKSYRADAKKMILDIDVQGYYPRIMINNGFSPSHLHKRSFIKALQVIVSRREELKPRAASDSRIKGIVQGLKIAANSVFGKTSDIYSWMFDRLCTMQVTITGELSLLMLIEALEEENIKVIMANTDGVTVYMDRDKIDKMKEIMSWWERLTQYKLEEKEYEFIAFTSVNDYIAKSVKGDVKIKGDFLVDSELHGDKSRRIVKIALYDYFVKGVPVEETILNHRNIYDFCIGVKSSEKFHYELAKPDKPGERQTLKKMVRYYVCKNGDLLFKVRNPEAEKATKGGNERHCESEDRVHGEYQPLVRYFNNYYDVNDFSEYNIDYNYYIIQAKSIIDKIERGIGRKNKVRPLKDDKQLSLF